MAEPIRKQCPFGGASVLETIVLGQFGHTQYVQKILQTNLWT